MTIKHHPAPECLMSCSAGSMPEAAAAVMACHMSICSRCKSELSILDAVGATLLEEMCPEALYLEAPSPRKEKSRPSPRTGDEISGDVPGPLQKFVGPRLKNVKWRRVVPGIWQYPIPLSEHSIASLRLIKVSPGLSLPDHGHFGSEITLVLQGAFTDEFGRYEVGDVVEVGEGVEHAPVAAAGSDCICLIASEGPMRFRGIFARIVQRFTGF